MYDNVDIIHTMTPHGLGDIFKIFNYFCSDMIQMYKNWIDKR